MKFIYLSTFCLFIASCKSQQHNLQENANYAMIEKVLSKTYYNALNFEIYTREFSIESFKGFIHNIKIDSDIDTTWFNDFSNLEKLYPQNKFDKWNPEKIEIKNLNTQFELKQKENIGYLNEMIERDNLDHRQAYEKKVIYWVKENGTFRILSSSAPLFSTNKEKAILMTSVYNQGITAWLFEKIDGVWKIILTKEVAIY